MLKNILIVLGVIVLVGVGAFLYATRAPLAPSRDVGTVALPSGHTPAADVRAYRISTTTSSVEFRIGEILNDKRNIAVGVTHDLAGEIRVSSTSVSMGTLAVSARTFKTDSERRDGAIARFILKSENPDNEFMTFTPMEITGAPASIGDTADLHLTVRGNLTIAGVTKPADFDVPMRMQDGTLSGTASTTLSRSSFGLAIPNVPRVASVDDQFTVTATVVADRVE